VCRWDTVDRETLSTTTVPVPFNDAVDHIKDCENFDSTPLVAINAWQGNTVVKYQVPWITFFGDDTIEEVGSDDDGEGPLVPAIL
jgi:hypothetical protein